MWPAVQGSGKDLIQPVLDNQLKAASPLVLPPEVCGALLHSSQRFHLCSAGGPRCAPRLVSTAKQTSKFGDHERLLDKKFVC